MQLPQRTPYAHKGELLHVYRSLYTLPEDPSQPDPRLRGLSHVHLFVNRAACPHAVESTAAIVQAIILDDSLSQVGASYSGQEDAESSHQPFFVMAAKEHSIRMSYALAITRFVNSIVDTAQTGFYAQSIAAIATRIGLPLAFVELRHAATHEELPSLAALREASHAALHWLEMHFWRPTLYAQGDLQDAPSRLGPSRGELFSYGASSGLAVSGGRSREDVLRENHPMFVSLLRSYKKVAKGVVRDASIAGRSKAPLRDLCARIEALSRSAAAEVASTNDAMREWDRGAVKRSRDEINEDAAAVNAADEDDAEDESAADLEAARILVDELLQPGALVPLSKEKRLRPKDGVAVDIPLLPATLSGPWWPLLIHLSNKFPSFIVLLAEGMVQALGSGAPTVAGGESSPADPMVRAPKTSGSSTSYRTTISAWLVYLPGVFDEPLSAAMDERVTDYSAAEEWGSSAVAFISYLCLSQPSHQALQLVRHLSLGSQSSEHVEWLLELASAKMGRDGVNTNPNGVGSLESAFAAAARDVPPALTVQTGFEVALASMRSRIADLDSASAPVGEANDVSPEIISDEQVSIQPASDEPHASAPGASTPVTLPRGWSLAPSDWKPTPIGMLCGKMPSLIPAGYT